jgi:protein-histidine N-methyltransferase
VDLLRALKSDGAAFVAAKRIYFGVGGGVPEFVQEIRKLGGSVKEVINITDCGVGRVILEISIT